MRRLDPTDLYEVHADLPDLADTVLLQALDGFVDAGSGKRLAREHLLETHGSDLVATFDVDALYDYRARRPVMLFDEDHWSSYDEPALEIRSSRDRSGSTFLTLTGPEPDVYWDAFCAAVRQLVEQLGVRLTVGLNSIPMAVPHTRPLGVIAHATRKDLVADQERFVGTVQVPASIGNLLEYRLGQAGLAAAGFAVAVPHYLAEAAYPRAAVALLDSVTAVSGLHLDTTSLIEKGAEVQAEIDKQIAGSEEVLAIVTALEQQYDASASGASRNLMAEMGGSLPTGEQIGAEFERYLADQGDSGT